MPKLPEIRIKDAWLLRQNASRHLHALWGKGKELTDDDRMARIVNDYQKAWEPLEHQILSGMCNTLNLEFRQNIIDVYIAPWFHAFSDPLVIGVTYEPDRFIDKLTHELLHRLLTDSTTAPYNTKFLPLWRGLFGEQRSKVVLIHIPLHAVHKAIYLDVLHAPNRLERDIAACAKVGAQDYIAAWEYVDQHGYKKIISQLHQSYAELPKQ